MENLDPPHNKSKIGKWRVLVVTQLDLDFWGVRVFAVPFYYVHDCGLGQNKVKFRPPPSPQIKNGKMVGFGLCTGSSLIAGGLGVCMLFHFIVSKIVA